MQLIDDLMAGKWVYGFDETVARMLLETEQLCFELNSTPPASCQKRAELFRQIVGKVEEPFTIHSPFRCDFGKHITIGSHFVGNFNLTILDEAQVTIGSHVFIGPNSSIYTINHALDAAQRNSGVMRARPVVIGDDVWIGGNVVVMPGVTIGHGAVVGAGSVVTRDVEPLTVVAGVPARVVKTISGADRVEIG